MVMELAKGGSEEEDGVELDEAAEVVVRVPVVLGAMP
jgi:hypothetical protein